MEWLRKHPEQAIRAAKYAKAHPELSRARQHRYSTRKAGAGGSYTQSELKALLELTGCLCAYCGLRPYQHLDHIVPVSKGGSSNIKNLLPACGYCNRSKGDKDLAVWLTLMGPVWVQRYGTFSAARPQ